MSIASGIRAGRAYVELMLKDNAFARGLDQAAKRLSQFGQTIAQIGKQLTAAAGVAGVPFALAARAAANFEQAMANVQALLRTTPENFDRLATEARRLGAETQYSATDAANAMEVMAMAGASVDEIMQATAPTLDLAATGMLGMAEAADITMKIMRGMEIPAAQVGYAVDVMAKAMTTANTDLRMLGDAFKYVGPIAHKAGVSLEETTAAIQVLSDSGIQGEMAGTTLRGAILSLTNPSNEAAKMMAKLGVQVADARGNFKPLADILSQFEAALNGLGTAKQAEIIGTIFDARQAAGFSVLVDKGSQLLRDRTLALHDAAGTARQVAATKMDTFWGDVERVRSAMEGLAITVGGALVPALREIGQLIVPIVNGFTTWAEANQQTIAAIAGTIAAVGAGGVALVGLGLTAQVTAFGLAGVGTAIAAVGTSVGLLISPVGLVGAALGGLGYAWATATKGGQEAVAALTTGWTGFAADAKDAWSAIVDRLQSGEMEGAMSVVAAGLKQIWASLILHLKQRWNALIDGIAKSVKENPWIGPLAGAALGGGAGFMVAGPGGAFVGGAAGALTGTAGVLAADDLATLAKADVLDAQRELIEARKNLQRVQAEIRATVPPVGAAAAAGVDAKAMPSANDIRAMLTGMRGALYTPFAAEQLGIDSARSEEIEELKKIAANTAQANKQLGKLGVGP